MKRNAFFSAVMATAALLLPGITQASHSMGADLTYKQLSTGAYKATLTLYRACGGASPASSYTLSRSACGGGFAVNRISTTDITPICPTAQSKCTNPASAYGWEAHVYEGTFTLAGTCPSTVISFTNCCRETGVGNLSNSGSQNLHISTLVTNIAANGGSHWNNPPMFTAPVNSPVTFNAGGKDLDGDVLVYSLANCRQSANTNVNYAAGFSGTAPLTTASGITIDSQTGQISFTPTAVMTGVVCIKAESYRGGTKIGETTRDIVVRVFDVGDAHPSLDTVCAVGVVGSNITFTATGSDPAGQGVTLSYDNGISGASVTFTGNGGVAPVATFSWTPTAPGTYYFTLTARDNNCDLNGVTQQAYTVTVNAAKSLSSDAASLVCAPQPFSGAFTLTGFLPSQDQQVEIQILDLQGRVLASQMTASQNGQFVLSMESAALAPGIYLAVARAGGSQAATRILKQ